MISGEHISIPSEETKLPHEPNRAITGFTKSPEGMDVIGMTFGGKDWILLRTMNSVPANLSRVQLKKELDIDSLPGLPFDWRKSLALKELVLFEDDGKPDKPVGIFIPAERFDEIVTRII